MTIHTLLREAVALPTIRGVAVLDLATGVSLGARGDEEQEAERLASDYARSLNATRQFLEPGADEDQVQELRVQTQDHHIFFVPLNPNRSDGIYLCLLQDRQSEEGSPFQREIQALRTQFQEEGGLLSATETEELYNYRV